MNAGRLPGNPAWQPSRLGSLWDMLELPIGRLMATYHKLCSQGQLIFQERNFRKVNSMVMAEKDYQELLANAEEFRDLCLEVSLIVTHHAAQTVCECVRGIPKGPKSDTRFFDQMAFLRLESYLIALTESMKNESRTKVAMILPPEMVGFYEASAPLFGADVDAKFTKASKDIDEAGKCLALGRSTACVFHLMRVLEVGLNAINACLNLPVPNNPNWGAILKPIADKVALLGRKHATSPRSE